MQHCLNCQSPVILNDKPFCGLQCEAQWRTKKSLEPPLNRIATKRAVATSESFWRAKSSHLSTTSRWALPSDFTESKDRA